MSKKRASGNLQFALFFLILVGGIIFLSLTLRFIFILKETKFDGSSHFTLESKGKNKIQFISFSPQNSTVGILTFENVNPTSEIPIDAKVDSAFEFDKANIKTSLFKMMFTFNTHREVNFIDLFRLDLFSQTVKESSIQEISVSQSTDKPKIDYILSSLFLDPKIQDEKLNIEVINATEVYGLGNKLANLVSNTGANVVLVSTGDLKKESVVEYSKPSYTADKIGKILRFKTKRVSKKSLADVTIIIGQDYVR